MPPAGLSAYTCAEATERRAQNSPRACSIGRPPWRAGTSRPTTGLATEPGPGHRRNRCSQATGPRHGGHRRSIPGRTVRDPGIPHDADLAVERGPDAGRRTGEGRDRSGSMGLGRLTAGVADAGIQPRVEEAVSEAAGASVLTLRGEQTLPAVPTAAATIVCGDGPCDLLAAPHVTAHVVAACMVGPATSDQLRFLLNNVGISSPGATRCGEDNQAPDQRGRHHYAHLDPGPQTVPSVSDAPTPALCRITARRGQSGRPRLTAGSAGTLCGLEGRSGLFAFGARLVRRGGVHPHRPTAPDAHLSGVLPVSPSRSGRHGRCW